jgi:hypothetical protein
MTAPPVVSLDATTIDALAEAVADRLRDETPVVAELVDAAEIARRFNVSRDWVYANADDLGAVRLGDGPRGRLRFDPAVVGERLGAENSPRVPSVCPRRSRGTTAALLPIRGRD